MLFNNDMVNQINAKIRRTGVYGKPQESFLESNIKEFQDSEERKAMLAGERYYRNGNDINNAKRTYIDRQGALREDTRLTNSKLAHAFMRKITKQKVNYLLSKEPTLKCENDSFLEALSDTFNEEFYKRLKSIGKDAIVKGLAWVQVYYDAKGELKFKRIPPEEVIPFWADIDRTILDAVIRYYDITEYLDSGEKKTVTKIEYHTMEGVWYYVKTPKGLKPDPEKGDGIAGHFSVMQEVKGEDGATVLDETGQPKMTTVEAIWDKVPFIAFKYNEDELGLLNWIKPLVDDYDRNNSNVSNILQDTPNNVKVVKNYDGTDKGEFVHNLATFRTAFVSGDGGLDSLDTPIDTQAVEAHLNRLRKDIYEFGGGVDTQETNLGNASGVALAFRYSDLASDANDMATEFAAALNTLIWFIKVDMLNKGAGDFMAEKVEVVFNTDTIVDEGSIITNAKNSQGIISDATIRANHPWVTDLAEEEKAMSKESEDKQKREIEFMKQTDPTFGQFGEGMNNNKGEGGDE